MTVHNADTRNPKPHVLLLGYSRIARKRLIPALRGFGRGARLDIASLRNAAGAGAEQCLPGAVFDSYDKALRESHAGMVYISLANSDHAPWAEQALLSGRHVVVDKPAFLAAADAERLIALAQSKNLLLAEANVFSYHPQIDRAVEAFDQAQSAPVKITALFSFPGFQQDDFRYQAACGGGALNDLGPYAVSAGTVFFREHPRRLFCRITERSSSGVDLAFTVAALYTRGRAMVGHFGFTTEYQNTISLLGPSVCIGFDRVFTIPADYANTLRVRSSDASREITVPPADCFANFLTRIFESIRNAQFRAWHEQVLLQASSLAMLKSSAHKEEGV